MANLEGALIYFNFTFDHAELRDWQEHNLFDPDLPFDDPAWQAIHRIPSERLGLRFRVEASSAEEARLSALDGEYDFDDDDIASILPEQRGAGGWWLVQLRGEVQRMSVRDCFADLRTSIGNHAILEYAAPQFTVEAFLNDLHGVQAWFEPLLRAVGAAALVGGTGTACIMAAGRESCGYVPFVGVRVGGATMETLVEHEYQNVSEDTMIAFMPSAVEKRIGDAVR